jgi:glycosyltransferase involved in cell wall biosynthesis
MSQPSISVVIPVRNEGRRLEAALRSIAAGRSWFFPLEIVLVDDASTDGCCDAVRDLFNWERDRVYLRIIRLATWSGIPYARNCGAFAAHGKILFITDANVIFQSRWDLPVVRRIRPRLALCATIADVASQFRGYGCLLDFPSMGVRWLPSPSLFGGYIPVAPCAGTIIESNLFRRLGGYDTSMPVYGAAEPEFSVRLWLSGAEIVVAPDLVVMHRFRPPTERKPFLDMIAALQVHNYLRFALLYLAESQVIEVLRYYALGAPDLVRKALTRLDRSDVWSRRTVLRSTLGQPFAVFARRFGLLGVLGRSATAASI